MSKGKIFLVCSGLGRVQRGFEIYIQSLAERLTSASNFKGNLKVFAGGKLMAPAFDAMKVFCISRNHWLISKIFSVQNMFTIEQASFFIFFLPSILFKRP